jgi:hypothetical protein
MQCISDWKVVRNRQDILAAMEAPGFEPSSFVLIETDPPQSFRNQSFPVDRSQRATDGVEVEEYAPRLVRARVHCTVPGIVLLADTFYPGWHATVDGAPAPIYRADYVMRAVFVSAGDHEIEFRYAPLAFRLGAEISAGTVAVLVLLGLWSRGRHPA